MSFVALAYGAIGIFGKMREDVMLAGLTQLLVLFGPSLFLLG